MKRVLILLLSALMAAALTGCHNSGSGSIYTNSGDRFLARKILEGNAISKRSSELPENGTRIQRISENANLPIAIIVNAEVQTPGGALPAAVVRPHIFSQEEADVMIEYLIGDAYFASLNHEESAAIYRRQAQITGELNGFPAASKEFGVAQDYSSLVSAQYIADNSDYFQHNKTQLTYYLENRIYGYFEKNDTIYSYYMARDETGRLSAMRFETFQRYPPASETVSDDASSPMTFDSALSIAEGAVTGIGAYQHGMRFSSMLEYNGTYIFFYSREINGITCSGDVMASNYSDDYTDYLMRYDPPWRSERLVVRVVENRISDIIWEYPRHVTVVLSENTQVLPFEQIMECFGNAMRIKYSDFRHMSSWFYSDGLAYLSNFERVPEGDIWPSDDEISLSNPFRIRREENNGQIDLETDNIEINITTISLSLSQIPAGEEYLIIPVWDFYGNITRTRSVKGSEEVYELELNPVVSDDQILMTISAIDGVILERQG